LASLKSNIGSLILGEEMSRHIFLLTVFAIAVTSLVIYYFYFPHGASLKPVLEINNVRVTPSSISFNVSNIGKGDAHGVEGSISFLVNIENNVTWVPFGGWSVGLIRAEESYSVSLNMTLPEAEGKGKITVVCDEGIEQESIFDLADG
jgi:hypothetical protein